MIKAEWECDERAGDRREVVMMHIRLAHVSDASELQKLNDLFNGEGCNTMEAIAESMRRNEQELVVVADEGTRLVGFCCGQILNSMCYDVPSGEITEFFVLETYRRQGIASELISFIETEFKKRGISHFQLLTGNSNKTAQAFYKSQGYTESTELLFCKHLQEG